MNRDRDELTSQLPSVLVAVTFLALAITAWGITSFVIDEDVMHYSDAGPLLGPSMATAATLTTWAWVVRVRKGAGVAVAAAGAAASAWLALVAVGAVGYTLTKGDLAWLLLFAGSYAASPFVLLPAVLSCGVVGVTGAVALRAKSFARLRRKD